VIRNPKQLLYTACFGPLAALGPLVSSGDSMIVIAQRAAAQGETLR